MVGDIKMITDRTQKDVSRVLILASKWANGTISDSEIAEWYTDMKGAYNASDLNRVGRAITYITGRLAPTGIHPRTVGKSDYTETDYNNAKYMDQYYEDIYLIHLSLKPKPDTPPMPLSIRGLYWYEANNIEKILEDVDYLITNMIQGFYYSGDFFAGEV